MSLTFFDVKACQRQDGWYQHDSTVGIAENDYALLPRSRQMKSLILGKNLSRVDVTHISTHGLWLLTHNSEIFVSFIDFPQFRTAAALKLKRVTQLPPNILYWPDLNIEIPVTQVRCFPLEFPKPRPALRSRRPAKARSVEA